MTIFFENPSCPVPVKLPSFIALPFLLMVTVVALGGADNAFCRCLRGRNRDMLLILGVRNVASPQKPIRRYSLLDTGERSFVPGEKCESPWPAQQAAQTRLVGLRSFTCATTPGQNVFLTFEVKYTRLIFWR